MRESELQIAPPVDAAPEPLPDMRSVILHH
jgi:hypothetical protein